MTSHLITIDKLGDEQALLFEFLHQFCESFEYFNLVLLIVGLTQCHRKLRSRDHAPLVVIAVAILLVIFVLLIQYRNINGRYFLTIFLITLPIQAAGAVCLIKWIQAIATPRITSHSHKILVAAGIVSAVSLLFWWEALASRHESRLAQANLGKHLRTHYGPFQQVQTDRQSGRVGFHAFGKMPYILYYTFQERLPNPDLIILERPIPASLRKRACENGLTEILLRDARQNEFSAFVRPSQTDQTFRPLTHPHVGVGQGNVSEPALTSLPEVLR